MNSNLLHPEQEEITKDYQEIVKEPELNFSTIKEWKEPSDTFQKYSMYEEYTIISISGSSTSY